MKKLFTLIAVALVAMSASAKEVLTLPQDMGAGITTEFGNWAWRDIAKLYTGAEVADDATDQGVVYYDASAYEYLVVKYKANTVTMNFGLQYNSKGVVGQWGAEFYSSQENIQAGTSGVVGVKLDADHKNTVYKVYMQSQGTGSIIIEEVYFGSTAEYEADLAANPVIPYVAPTLPLSLDNATNTWGTATYDAATHTATLESDGAADGWWVNGADFSNYKYFVIEVENMQKVGYAQLILFGNNHPLDGGSYVKVFDISGYERNQPNGMNLVVQGGAGTSWTWKAAYFATEEYVTENDIHDHMVYGDTQEMGFAGFNCWKNDEEQPRATFDAATGLLTISATEDGGGSWWIGGQDFSHFDNFVLELEPTQFGGSVVVQYGESAAPALAPKADEPTNQSKVSFGTGATNVVVPLSAAQKANVLQVWVAADAGASLTMKKAYFAVASATPEANLGELTGISAINANVNVNAPMYNLAGQRVDAQFKGVVIQNGRKFMKK